MNGRPVWLASGSLRDSFGNVIPSARWQPEDRRLLENTLLSVLDGVGDPSFERFFRMPATACIHRKLTEQEEAKLHPSWHAIPPQHIAGGPLEILRESVEGAPSTKPCKEPRKAPVGSDPDIYLLRDCGYCEPCRARAAAECRP